HGGNLAPGNLGVHIPNAVGNVLRRLTNDFQSADDRVLDQFLLEEVLSAQTPCVTLDSTDRLENILNVEVKCPTQRMRISSARICSLMSGLIASY
ncbi:MAG: hypothetical protein QOF51_1794, partial [Chloroflexota bacterium]|nr:hypothetical protein [Chloroflexota bacterium]